jgi:L-threonylcarbamoyladenylate synthase
MLFRFTFRYSRRAILRSNDVSPCYQNRLYRFTTINISPSHISAVATMSAHPAARTQILPVEPAEIGHIEPVEAPVIHGQPHAWIEDWELKLSDSESAKHLMQAANKIRQEDLPVAFPTETVYGLGADATRSAAVKSIFAAKQRPADNPLIVHFASIKQLRHLLRGNNAEAQSEDPIPSIYQPLIHSFWPGPLTILLQLPSPSPLAPEVTAGLHTFGARIPASPIALALIRLADVPVAAPSANASTRPSPTTAEHVAQDLDGRLEIILDGGPCDVGVESTVVDGLVSPPVILRPGGIGVEQLRKCSGWENVRVAYEDKAQKSNDIPKAPGMKYKHYSPRAKVVLHEEKSSPPTFTEIARISQWEKVGFVRTRRWREYPLFSDSVKHQNGGVMSATEKSPNGSFDFKSNPSYLPAAVCQYTLKSHVVTIYDEATGSQITAIVVDLGPDAKDVARGLFSALRELDSRGVSAIFVEGIADSEGDVAAAVMNRLRKAAEVNVHE